MRDIWFVTCILFFAQIVFAQSDVRTPTGTPLPKTIKEVRERDVETRMANMRRLSQISREQPIEKPKTMSREELQRFKALTKPSDEDIANHRASLDQKNTGIFRILPDFDCETENIVKAGGECKNFMPGTWMYSIRKEDHSSLDLHDLAFKRDRLVSNSLLAQGLMVSLGDVSLEKVTLNRQELSFLNGFVPATDKEKARAQFEELSKGIDKNGVLYANNFAVMENNTYVLRVIAYRLKDKYSIRLRPENIGTTKNGVRFAALRSDKRNDSVFAFRVLRKSTDGGITIIWKELSKTKSPQMVFQKSEILKGFKTKEKEN